MKELLTQINKWQDEGKDVALATVVKIYGSAPQPLGAKMVISDQGEMAGSVSGGCVEGAVVQEALDVLALGQPKLVEYGIADEWAMTVGLACGGNIEVFVEPASNMPADFAEAVHAGRLVGLATVIADESAGGSGSAAMMGSKRLVYADGSTVGSLGDGDADVATTNAAAQQLAQQKSSRIRIPRGDDSGGNSEDASENTLAENTVAETNTQNVEVFIDVYSPPLKLIVVGAVHIAIPLVTFANELGFETIVVDARGAFATPERFPHADRLITQWPADALEDIGLDEATYMVVLTHDAKIDNPAILKALESPIRYLGALGSRKTHAKRVAALTELGATEAQLSRIHAPIGLNLGGRRPEEIAVSVIGEIVGVKNNSALTAKV
ncbi:MAG: XdhC/CoxI family protein [Chloroflexota bacterium]